ncbi:unnamed protein product [Ilex paraguariensis]|uniref:Uncharacterized protein n=1 Tax=Ilex paraguariensis TaxID=185542 RepID=A0ABC8TXG5_9AQUA
MEHLCILELSIAHPELEPAISKLLEWIYDNNNSKAFCQEITSSVGRFSLREKEEFTGRTGGKESFNNAMVARQAWRLVQTLQSLWAQVLRAKYYAGQSLWQLKPKAASS